MITSYADLFKITELRRKFLFTIGMIFVFRLGIYVPVPGLDGQKIKQLLESNAGALFGMMNMFTGGALENVSVLMLGIAPYISMSIIVQLLAKTVKSIEEIQKEGESGRKRLTSYIRIGAIVLSFVQGFSAAAGFESNGLAVGSGFFFKFNTALTLAAGTAFVMWLGEQITERGIGNGISLLIMAGIVARMPAMISQTLTLISSGELNPIVALFMFAFAISTVLFIVYFEKAQRKIPVQYPKRVVGKQVTQSMTQYLPFKLNSSGVYPPMFAGAVFAMLGFVSSFTDLKGLKRIIDSVTSNIFIYEGITVFLILFFAYVFTAMLVEPEKTAESLKKNGGFIPSIRPGKETENYLTDVLSRLTLWGGIYLAIIAVLPSIIYGQLGQGGFNAIFGGTAILICVGVMLDTSSQIQSYIMTHNYEAYIKKAEGASPAKIRGMSRATQVGGTLIKR